MNSILDFISCIADEVLLLLGGYIVFFVASKISHTIKKRRGNPQKYWDKYWAAKKIAEEERLKDPSFRVQKVWDEQDERNKDNQRRMVHEVITATGRHEHSTPMNNQEVLQKIRLGEYPFAEWMLEEYLDGSLLNDDPTYAQRIQRWLTEAFHRDI